MAKKVEHSGKVIGADVGVVDVVLDITQEQCGECLLRNICEIRGEEHKVLSLLVESDAEYGVGDEVVVVIQEVVGVKAVMLVYALPAMALFILVATLLALGVTKTMSGLTGLVAITIYYLLLYVTRDRLVKESTFRLK